MDVRQLRRGCVLAVLFLALTATVPAAAVQAADTGWKQQNHKGVQFVQVTLGEPDQELGLRLVTDLPDGATRVVPEEGGRQSVAGAAGGERFFYLDVHDTYVRGGSNKVRMMITYRDLGLTPIFLEYDAYDPLRPQSKVDELTRKRIPVATRTNTEGWKTQFIELDDARFAGGQPGGADFRIGSADDLILRGVSVMVLSHTEPLAAVQVRLNGSLVAFDPNEVQPYVDPVTNRTLVPFRALFNALGIANEDIVWHNETRTVEFRKGQTIVLLPIDKTTATVNGQPQALDQPATIVGGRTVVPVRFVTQTLGFEVKWIQAERTVELTTRAADPSVAVPGEPTPPTVPVQPVPPTQPKP